MKIQKFDKVRATGACTTTSTGESAGMITHTAPSQIQHACNRLKKNLPWPFISNHTQTPDTSSFMPVSASITYSLIVDH